MTPPQNILGCPACGMRVTGTESECPRCHKKFASDSKFECPFCGELIPKDSDRCPTCQVDFHGFGPTEHKTVEQTADKILEELTQLESSLIKEDRTRHPCPDCSWLLNGTESVCPRCGRALMDFEKVTCPICLAPNRKGAKECEVCGAEISKGSIKEKPPPAQPAPSAIPETFPLEEVTSSVLETASDLHELESLLKCPRCGAPTRMEATSCPKCGASLAEEAGPIPEPEETPTDAAATEALETLGEIERNAEAAKAGGSPQGKVTAVEARPAPGGRGFSNGLGQTNGTGRINGRGRINGTGAINGRSLVNGRGMSNGRGRTNGTGAINGHSLVNGRGMSNGLRAKATAYSSRRRRTLLRWQFFAIIAALVVVIPTVIYFVLPGEKEPITIDGDFSDWSETTKFGASTLSGSPSIDITEWATYELGYALYAYARTEGPPMASVGVESFFLFIDSDGSEDTGYLAGGIGADYLLRLDGWNGSVQYSALQGRASGADQYDWNSWQYVGFAQARVEGTGIEMRGSMPVTLPDSARFVLMAKDYSDEICVTHAAPSKGGLLVVELTPSLEAADGVIPAATSASIVTARFTCQGSGGSVSSVTPTITGAYPASTIPAFALSPGGEQVFEIQVDSTGSSAEGVVRATVSSSGISSTFSAVQIEGGEVSAYVGSAPQEVVIDGAFGDWAGRTTMDEDALPITNAALDIDRTGNSSASDASYFYVSVKGELLDGCCVPVKLERPSTSGGGNNVPVRKTGEDILRVYIDGDNSNATGLGVQYGSKNIGADHKVEIAGINGRIVSSSYWNYTGGRWVESDGQVQAAKDYSQIEVGVDGRLVNGQMNIEFIVETSCWKDEFDRATYEPSMVVHSTTWIGGISTSATATSMSFQRKIFWDGTNLWSFYFDGSNTICKYSVNGGVTWTSRGSVFKTSAVTEVSIWYDSANSAVYAIGDTGTASTSVYVQKGAVSPSTHAITWAASDSTVTASTNSLAGKNTYISRDASGYVWFMSTDYVSTSPQSYDLAAYKNTATDTITGTWTLTGRMSATSNQDTVKGSIVPAGSGSDVWAVYIYAGTVASRKYTGSWSSQSSIYAASGVGSNTEDAPPSVLVDSSGVVHVVYGDDATTGKPKIYYTYNSGSGWASSAALSATTPKTNGYKYPTISLDTSTGNLYAFWFDMQTSYVVCKKKVSGTWSSVTLNAQTADGKAHVTSIYSAPSETYISFQWTQNTTGTIHVIFDKIPEFGDLAFPVFSALMICVALRLRASRKDRD